jgi:hypothetical protein
MRGRQQRAGVVGGEGLRRAGTFHCGEVLNIGLRGIDHWVERSSGWIFVHDIGLVMETRSHGQSCRVEAVTTLILVLVEVLRGLDLRAGGGEGETLLLETDAKEGRL